MQLIEVKDDNTKKQFHRLPFAIYKNIPKWIPPLEKDVEGVFDPEKNPSFSDGEAIRWILMDDSGTCIGRVAAFVNNKLIAAMEYPCGGMGFFECINDKKAAFMLFDACKKWLHDRGMQAMEGPVNFGERDKFWGLLVESEEEPSYLENFHPFYYKNFFEEYGFKNYFEQYTFKLMPADFEEERFRKIVERIQRRPGVELKHFDPKNIDKFIIDFITVYNAAWSKFENFKPLSYEDVQNIFSELKPILVPEFLWYAYVNGTPAGFFIVLPDVNQLFKFVDGKLDLIGKLKFVFYKTFRPIDRLKALVFGIMPGYQNQGLDAALFYNAYNELKKFPQFTSSEIAWIGSFNPKMQSLMSNLGATISKKHITYRKLFDDSIEFKAYKLKEYE